MAYNSYIKSEDIRMSNIVNDFVVNEFYNKYVSDLEIVTDKERQILGIDTIFNINGQTYRCDEKSAIRWRNLKTFSLELSFLNRNNDEQLGWFVSDKQVNELYLFIWIDGSKSDYDNFKNITCVDDIYKAEFALVRKSDIKDYLNSIGWTHDKLLKKSYNIRHNNDRQFGDIYTNKIKFSYSEKLSEKPINILIPRNKLVELSIINHKI